VLTDIMYQFRDYQFRDLLAPVALRSRPLSPIARATLVIGAVAALTMCTNAHRLP